MDLHNLNGHDIDVYALEGKSYLTMRQSVFYMARMTTSILLPKA